ncbi:MAG TPA: KGG domain-containing protein [Patescibacteria group bacterium]|nr:KGG domain-containing protein [Patescibacteria group bacterium]
MARETMKRVSKNNSNFKDDSQKASEAGKKGGQNSSRSS